MDGFIKEIGMCYKNLDKKEEALEYYLKAVELDEEDTYSISDIAWLYNNLGKHEEALKFLQRLEKIGVMILGQTQNMLIAYQNLIDMKKQLEN